MASFVTNLVLIVLSVTSIIHAQPLSRTFYRKTCPNLLSTVRSMVEDIVANEPRMGASLLRLHFHDCFVSGCDASLLMDGGEMESFQNMNSLRGREVIDTIKEQVENICGGVISCADILALMHENLLSRVRQWRIQDIASLLGGPSWPMVYGRRDSTTPASVERANNNLPSATDDLPQLISLFARKGFSPREMVALSGAHTIGQARCIRFRDRIYNEPNIALSLVVTLQEICPRTPGDGDDNLGPLDSVSPNVFNNDYFWNLMDGQGVLHSDQVLFTTTGSRIDRTVEFYANNQGRFFADFSSAMFKMSQLNVKTGRQGMVRINCKSASG